MTNYLLVPGLGNSGPEHWQTYFENSGDNFYRIEQHEWEEPTCEEWIKKNRSKSFNVRPFFSCTYWT
jgi:uncharacterized protein